jgi:hypothetical protein
MTRYAYDEESSAALHMDVVHEIEDLEPVPVARWVEAMRRLNGIKDPLARQILAIHRDCGSGSGACDGSESDATPISHRAHWGCETTEVVAQHFGVEYPQPPGR